MITITRQRRPPLPLHRDHEAEAKEGVEEDGVEEDVVEVEVEVGRTGGSFNSGQQSHRPLRRRPLCRPITNPGQMAASSTTTPTRTFPTN